MPFRLDALWPFAERLERFGIAGFGWGVSWIDAAGRLASYRDVRAFRDDPGRDDGRRDRDDRGPRPPASTVEAVDADAAGHAAVRRPGRTLRVQPQRRPARLPSPARDLSRRRAGSTDAPTRRSARAGSRTPGTRTSPSPTCSAALHDRFGGPGEPGRPRRRRDAASLRGQRREPGLRLPARADRRGLDRDLLARPVAVPVRRPRGHRSPARAAPSTTSSLGRDGRPMAMP